MTLKGLRNRSNQLLQFGAKRKIIKPAAEDVSHALLKSPHTGTQDKANLIANMLGKRKQKLQHGIEGSEDMGGGQL